GCTGSPSTKTWTYTTDNLVASDTDAGGDATSYLRDQVGNPIQVYSPSANARDANNTSGTPTSITYTNDNRLLTTTQPASPDGTQVRQTSYTYAPFGGKASQSVVLITPQGNAAGGTQSFAYYPDNRLQTATGRAGEQISQSYDAAGHLTYVTSG